MAAKKRKATKRKTTKRKTTKRRAKAPLEVEVTIKQGKRKLATMSRRAPTTAQQWNDWLKRCKAAKNCASNVLASEAELAKVK